MSTLDMTTLPDTFADCGTGSGSELPADPYTALRFHFGMLLGVDDFEVEQGFHHGKQRLHNAWLHRDGVVWGLGVDAASDEIRVHPGLALDGAGRELHLDDDACVSLTAWYSAHESDVGATPDQNGQVTFDAYVVAHYAACPMRPVPALAEPCAGMTTDTAYSRTYETIDLQLIAGAPPAATTPAPYHRLRVLFGLDALTPNDDKATADARDAVLAGGGRAADKLAALNQLAVADSLDLHPATQPDEPATRYPALEDDGVLLALIHGITLAPGGTDGTGWIVGTNGTVTYDGRRTLLPTQTIQELLSQTATAGPSFTDVTLDSAAQTVTLTADADLLPETVTADAFSVTRLDGGWQTQTITNVETPDTTHVRLTLDALTAGKQFRVLARGTGPTPILGADLAPLGGGSDFAAMKGS